MPRGDRTGPMGFGPLTGRGGGFCAGYNMPDWTSPVPGRGVWGRSGGGGRGWRHWLHATGLPGWARAGMGFPGWGASPSPFMAPVVPGMSAEAEVDALKAQAGHLEQTLQYLRQRIEKLEDEAKSE